MNERFYRANHQIKLSPIVLIDQDGRNVGSVSVQKAMELASVAGLDLVEISPNSRPPVCRIMDFGKFKYAQAIKEKNQRKKQTKVSHLKEIHLSPSIEKHDMETKSKAARRFIESEFKVVVKLVFRRRELAHRDVGDRVMAEFLSGLKDICEVSSRPKHEGKSIVCTISPLDPTKKI